MKLLSITVALLLATSSGHKVKFTDFFSDEDNVEIQNKISGMDKEDVQALSEIDHKIDQAQRNAF